MLLPNSGPRALALVAILSGALALPARALVDGEPPSQIAKYTVQGNGTMFGNNTLRTEGDALVNSVVMATAETSYRLESVPTDASLVGAHVFWSGSLGVSETIDNTATVWLPDGTTATVTATNCRERGLVGVSRAYYCSADVRAQLATHLTPQADGSRTINGTYNVSDFTAVPGTRSANPGQCPRSAQIPCQAAYGGWAMVVVWSSRTVATTRDVVLYDGFLRMDETCEFDMNGSCSPGDGSLTAPTSSGISPAIRLGGFTASPLQGSNPGPQISFFALEGDQLLGSPPESRTQNADFLCVGRANAATGLLGSDSFCQGSTALGSTPGSGALPRNLFDSTVLGRQGGFAGVDIKTLPFTLPTDIPFTTTVDIQPGAGDGVPDTGGSTGSNGELFYLGAVMVAVDSAAPNFRNSTKAVDRATAAPGDVLTYTMTVENSALVPANTRLSDVIPTDLVYVPNSTTLRGARVADVGGRSPLIAGMSLGSMSSIFNTRAVVTFQARIRADYPGGTICNTAAIDATYRLLGPPDITLATVNLRTPDPCTQVQLPNLRQPSLGALVDGVVTREARTGSRIRYTARITNGGAAAANGVSFTADVPKFVKALDVRTIPPGATDASATTGGVNGTGTVSVTGFNVPANAFVDIVFDVEVLSAAEFATGGGRDGEQLTIRGRLSGAPVSPSLAQTDDPQTPANDATTVTVRLGVDLSTSSKTVTGDTAGVAAPGAALTYTIRLTNSGTSPATASLSDDLPANVGGCSVVTGPITCAAGGANGTGRVTGSNITVAGGASVDVSFRVNVSGTAADGARITNTGTVTAAERPGVNWTVTSPTVTVRSQVVFAMTKSVTDVNGGSPDPGDELLYTIALRNTGNRASLSVTISDPIDPNLSFLSASDGGTNSNGTITWSSPATPALASIAPNATVTVTFRARINANVGNGTTISNQARAESADARALSDDPGTAAPNDPTLVRIVASPSFVDSTKSVVDQNGGQVRPGDVLEWRLDVRNTGRAQGTSIVVTDTVDTNLTIDTIGNGGVRSGNTITWNIASLAAGAAHPTITFTTRVNTPLANGTRITNQAQIRSAEVAAAVPTDDPSTPALDDATGVTVSSIVTLAGSTKTATDVNGGEALPGDQIRWTIRVTATGDAPARSVVVSDPIGACLTNVTPANGGVFSAGAVRWESTATPSLANVPPGAPVELSFTATIAPGTADGTACANQASLNSPDVPASALTDDPATPAANDPTIVRVVSKPVLTASTKVAVVTTDANGDAAPSPGDRVRYTITVSNTGSEPARGVVATDTLSTLLTAIALGNGGTLAGRVATWNVGDVPALGTRELTIDATIAKPLDDGTLLDNQASLRATNLATPALTDDPATAAANDPTRLVLKSAPKFTSTKTVADVNGGRVEPGDLLRYTLKLKNEGTSLARAVRLEDVLDANLTYVSSSPAGAFDASTRTLAFAGGTLDLTTEQTFTIDARIATGLDNGTPIDNQSRATSAELLTPTFSDDPGTPATNDPTRVVVISAADLSTSTKTFVDRNGGQLRPGDLVDYTINVRNTGNATARNVRIDDVLDARLAVQAPIDAGGVLGSNNTVTWNLAQPIAPGASATVRLAVRVALPLANGTEIPNQATLNAQGLVTPFLTDDPTTPAPSDATRLRITSAPILAATKTVTDVNGGDVRPGDELRYTITARNTGDAEGTGTTITDVLEGNLDFVSAAASGTFDAASRTITWNVGRLGVSPLESSVSFTARLRRPLANGTVVANQASVRVAELPALARTDDPATPAPNDATRVTVVARPDLDRSEKRVTDLNGGVFAPEDEVEYAIVVKNTGDNAASTVVVTDVIDPIFTAVTALDGGSFNASTRTASWSIPSVDVSPAGDRTLRLRARIAPLLANGTRVANQARIASPSIPVPVLTDDPATPAPSDATEFRITSAPALNTSSKIVVDEDGGLVRPGDSLVYTITVKNTGNTYATDVVVEDPIDPALGDIRADQGGTFVGGRIRWDRTTTSALTRIAPRSDVTLTFRARIRLDARNGAAIGNQAIIGSAEGVSAPTDDPGTPEPGDPTRITPLFPDLSKTTKTVVDENGGNVEPGDFLTYTLRIVNDGALVATDVRVEDPIDPNLVEAAARNGGVLANGRITWNSVGNDSLARLERGRPVELTVRARVKPLTRNATIVANQATVTIRELAQPLLTDADLATEPRDPVKVTVVSRPNLETTTLEVTDENGGEARPGDRLTYRATVRNTGNTWATNAVATFALPPELQAITTEPACQGACTSEVRFDRTNATALAEVEPGRDVVLTIKATLRSPLANGTLVSVQGSLAADELDAPVLTDDPTTAEVDDPTTLRVFSAPRFSTTEKSLTDLNGGRLEPGDVVLYDIVVLNDGTETGTGVRVFDVVPAGTTYVKGSLTLNGARVDDALGFPLVNGLLVKSARANAPDGSVFADDGAAPDDEAAHVQYRVTLGRALYQGTTISNQARIRSDNAREALSDDPATAQLGDATIGLVGEGGSVVNTRLDWRLVEDRNAPGIVNPDDLVELTVEVPNSGNAPVECTVELPVASRLFAPDGDLVLDGRTLTASGGDDAGEWTGDAIPIAKVQLGSIAPRRLARVALRLRAQDGTEGVASLQAVVKCAALADRASDSDGALPGEQPARIPVRLVGSEGRADLTSTTKTVEDLNGGTVQPGDELRWRIQLVNDGSAPASRLAVTDVLPAGVELVAGSVETEGGLFAEGTSEGGTSVVTGTLEGLAPGARAAVVFRTRVGNLPEGREIRNVATIAGQGLETLDRRASVNVGSMAGAGTIVGRLWEDVDESGTFDAAKDEAYAGFQIQIRTRDGASAPGRVLTSVFADDKGEYRVANLPAGGYTLSFRAPDGAEWARTDVDRLAAGATLLVDLALVPTGLAYRTGEGTGVANAKVIVFYDAASIGRTPPACDTGGPIARAIDPDLGLNLPRRVPEGCLAPGQQGQRTISNGAYKLSLPASDEPIDYRLHLVSPSVTLSFPSNVRAAEPSFAPAGEKVGRKRRPAATSVPEPYFTHLRASQATDAPTNNHIPLDALEDAIRITKEASRGAVRVGEFVTYTVVVANGSARDLVNVGGTGGLELVDAFPPHLRYVRGTTRAFRRQPQGLSYVDTCASLDGGKDTDCAAGKREPQGVGEGTGRLGRFGPYDVKAGETLVLRYMLSVTGAAKPGDYDNIAYAQSGGVRVTRDAKATVRVLWDALFDESTIIGKVFCDDDRNGLQTPGEEGVGLARVYADNGFYVEADNDGKFHFLGLKPGLHLFKLDARHLPHGVDPGTQVRQSLYLTPGLDTRVNFPVQCAWAEARPERVQLLTDPPKPPPPPPPPPPALVITGALEPLSLAIDGVDERLPQADVTVDVRDADRRAAQNVALKANGQLAEEIAFRILPLAGPMPRGWTFTVSDEAGQKLFEQSGTGTPPTLLPWNGRDEAGRIVLAKGGRYLYRLKLEASPRASFTTAPKAFGVEWRDLKAADAFEPLTALPIEKTLSGGLFGMTDAKPKGALIKAVADLARQAPKGDGKIRVEVFTDPSDAKKAQAITDARAKAIVGLFVAQGIAEGRLQAIGRGAADPVAEAPKAAKGKKVDRKAVEAAKEANRRVFVSIDLPAPPPPPPAAVPQPEPKAPEILVGNNPVLPGENGRFRAETPRPMDGTLPVRVVGRSGATILSLWKPGQKVAQIAAGQLLVEVDVGRSRATVGAGELALPLLATRVQLSDGGIVELNDAGAKAPLRFSTSATASVASWQLALRDANGAVVKQLDGKGAIPAELTWDGKGLRPGQYTYQLSATDPAGNKFASARRPALGFLPPPVIDMVLGEAALFGNAKSAKVQKSARKSLGDLAMRLFQTEGGIVIEGHSDAPEGAKLAEERATAVRAVLVEAGVPAARLTTVGRGASSPAVPNLNKKSREKNRRVEVRTAQKLPLLPERPETLSVSIGGQPANDVGDGLFKVMLPAPPTGALEITVTGSNGRSIDYKVELPAPELHEDRAGTSSFFARARAFLAQAGDDLPPLPDFDLPPDLLPPTETPDAGTPAPAPATPAKVVPVDAGTPAPALVTPTPAPKAPESETITIGGDTGDVVATDRPTSASDGVAIEEIAPKVEPLTIEPREPAPAATASTEAPKAAPLADPKALPPDEAVGDKILVAKFADEAPPETIALKLQARLPPEGTVLRSTRFLLKGSTDPRNELTVNGEKLALDELGRFARVFDLPAGEASFTLATKDPDGNRASLVRRYTVDPKGLFLMGLANGEFGTTGGENAGLDTLGLKVAGTRRLFVGGRVAGLAAGELDVGEKTGGFFKSLKLVANVDSSRRNDDAAFRDLIDPSRYYPAVGDGSTLVQEAPARGPVYARVDADDSHALFGDFRTGLGGTELFRYDRTLYGADLTFKRKWNDKVTTQLQLMGAPGDARVRHGHVELLATGGSLYYLQGGNVIEGTERVRIVVRDRDTGIEIARSDRTRYADYFVSYVEGRLLFKQPVSQAVDATFLVNNNLGTALQGHPVFVVVDYEYRDVAGDAGASLGFHTREEFLGGKVTVGGGLLSESRGAADPYRLWGAEIGGKLTDRTYAKAEFARSAGTDANSFFSSNGGLTYSALATCLPGSPSCATGGDAWKFEAVGALDDFFPKAPVDPAAPAAELTADVKPKESPTARLYFQDLGAGFFANGLLIEQGQRKYGAQVRVPLGEKDALALRHDSVESVLDGDLMAAGIQAKNVTRRLSGLQYRHTEARWGAVAEYAHALTSDSWAERAGLEAVSTNTLLAGGTYKPLDKLNLFLNQEGILTGDPRLMANGWTDRLTTTLGAQYQLNEYLSASLAESVRWSGENATQLGLSTRISDVATAYLNERFSARAGQLVSTTLVGGATEIGKGTRAYGEYQLDGAQGTTQNRAVLGLNNRWSPLEGMTLSAGWERSQVLGDGVLGSAGVTGSGGALGAAPGATQGGVFGVPAFGAPGMNPQTSIMPGTASRDVGSVGLEWLRSRTFKASARLENRIDLADPRYGHVAGVADRLQVLLLSTVDWKWSDDVTFLTRVVWMDSLSQAADKTFGEILAGRLDARYLEATGGFAFRPKQYDWVAVLLKASRVIDGRPMPGATGIADMQVADVVSLAPSFETPFNVGFSMKLAYKHVRAIVSGQPTVQSHVFLNVNRVDWHVLPQLDLTGEYRLLRTSIDRIIADGPAQGTLRHGAVAELAYRPMPFVRLGLGYNFATFSDNELSRLDDMAQGVFLRATGQY